MTANSKIKLTFGQLNWWGMLVSFGTGFSSVFFTNLGMAQSSGIPFWDAVKTSAIAGVMSGGSSVAGVLTQRSKGADGTPIFPGLVSTDTAAVASSVPAIRFDTPESMLLAAVQQGELAWNELQARKKDQQDADQAKADEDAATAAQIEQLKAALATLEAKQAQSEVK